MLNRFQAIWDQIADFMQSRGAFPSYLEVSPWYTPSRCYVGSAAPVVNSRPSSVALCGLCGLVREITSTKARRCAFVLRRLIPDGLRVFGICGRRRESRPRWTSSQAIGALTLRGKETLCCRRTSTISPCQHRRCARIATRPLRGHNSPPIPGISGSRPWRPWGCPCGLHLALGCLGGHSHPFGGVRGHGWRMVAEFLPAVAISPTEAWSWGTATRKGARFWTQACF